jgi:hypothetical protein
MYLLAIGADPLLQGETNRSLYLYESEYGLTLFVRYLTESEKHPLSSHKSCKLYKQFTYIILHVFYTISPKVKA